MRTEKVRGKGNNKRYNKATSCHHCCAIFCSESTVQLHFILLGPYFCKCELLFFVSFCVCPNVSLASLKLKRWRRKHRRSRHHDLSSYFLAKKYWRWALRPNPGWWRQIIFTSRAQKNPVIPHPRRKAVCNSSSFFSFQWLLLHKTSCSWYHTVFEFTRFRATTIQKYRCWCCVVLRGEPFHSSHHHLIFLNRRRGRREAALLHIKGWCTVSGAKTVDMGDFNYIVWKIPAV